MPEAGPDADLDTRTKCTTNDVCFQEAQANAGNLGMCVRGRCTQIDPELCGRQVYPKPDFLARPNVVLFPVFTSTLFQVAESSPAGRAYRLAVAELDLGGGIAVGSGYSVAMIFCSSDLALVDRAVAHVVDDLHVPGLVAGFSASDISRYTRERFKPNDVFVVNPSAASEGLKYDDTGQLVLNLLGPPEDVALAYRPVLARAETKARKRTGKLAGEKIRVALLWTKSSTDTAMDVVLRLGPVDRSPNATRPYVSELAMKFNGLSAEANGADFAMFEIPSFELTLGTQLPTEADAQKIADFRPDIVIALTSDELKDFLPIVEAKMLQKGAAGDAGADAGDAGDAGGDSGVGPTPPVLPVWILGPRNALSGQAYVNSSTNDTQTRKADRFLGVQYAAGEQVEKQAWLARMEKEYGAAAAATKQWNASENFYDAIYWLAYGLGAAGAGAAVSGTSIKTGVRKLISGTQQIRPGDASLIAEAFVPLRLGRDVSYVGALGTQRVNDALRTWESVGSVYCFDWNGQSAAVRYDGLVYNAKTGELDEIQTCFPNFLPP